MGRRKGSLNTKTKREILDKKYPGEGWMTKTDKEVKDKFSEVEASEKATE